MSQETRFKETSESNTCFEDMFHRWILDSERTDLCEVKKSLEIKKYIVNITLLIKVHIIRVI